MKLSAFESKQIFRENLIWLMVAQAASIVPLLQYLPIWIVLVWLVAIFWRVLIFRGKLKFPNTTTKLFLTIASIVAIYFHYAGKVSAEPMVAFLVCAFVLKIIEMQTRKDALIVLFIAFIAIATQFLFAQDLLAGIYGLTSLFVLISAWASIFRHAKLSVWQHLKIGGRLVVYSAPMMLVMFVVMPRLGPLWAVPVPGNQGKTGFSDSLELGEIGNLVRTPNVAFRARFKGDAPPPRELYWRGLVLDRFDGYRWDAWFYDKGARPIDNIAARSQSGDDSQYLDYSVILEPHQNQWLFAVGYPQMAQSAQLKIALNDYGLLLSRQPVIQKAEYSALSSLTQAYAELSDFERRKNLDLPQEHNPRAKVLVKDWLQSGLTESEIVNEALKYYAKDFTYTLRTDQVRVNAIDYFLFESKRGFCEHFASSFVFLMRSAGVPARIVMGYQGGELNEGNNYYIVRQSDAHAWAEVWLESQGWVRVDPTGAVAPNRIDMGVDEALTQDDRKLMSVNWQGKIFSGLAKRWDALSYSWNLWVLNYDQSKQQGLLTKLLGSADPWRVALAIAVLASGILMPIFVLQYWRSKKRYELSENQMIQPVLNHLDKLGFKREPSESCHIFLRQVAVQNPELSGALIKLADAYEGECYRQNSSESDLAQTVSDSLGLLRRARMVVG